MTDELRETLTPGRDAGFNQPPKPGPKKKATTKKAAEPAPDEE